MARCRFSIMIYELIQNIADRCWASAQQRGKATSAAGCIAGLNTELSEYWNAAKDDRTAEYIDILHAAELEDTDFVDFYESRIHNTTTDELADIVLVAATWFASAKQAAGAEFDPEKSADVMLLSGALSFAANQCEKRKDVEKLRDTVNLKMRFNELRQD